MAEEAGQRVGGSIQSVCTKCKAPTRHTIVSLVGGRAARVQCSQCDGVHNYRDPAGLVKAAGGGGRTGKGVPRARTLEEEWLAQMKGRDPRQAILYGDATHPQAGDLVDHPTFGYGYVLKVLPPHKVEVHFRHGVRLLRW